MHNKSRLINCKKKPASSRLFNFIINPLMPINIIVQINVHFLNGFAF